MRTRVKVSGLLSPAEARAAVGAGADALGFGPEARGAAGGWEAIAACPPGVSPVLHTTREDAAAIAAEAREAGVAAVQLPAGLDPAAALALRRQARGLRLIQTMRLDDEGAVELARAYSRLVDALVIEAPAPVITLGDLESHAEARRRDWRGARRAAQASAVPVWLAGGLNQGSVGEAVDEVNPFGVDVGAGVRTGGRLDARKLSAFFHAVRVAKTG